MHDERNIKTNCSVFSIFLLEAVQLIKLTLNGLWNKSIANSVGKLIYISYVVIEDRFCGLVVRVSGYR